MSETFEATLYSTHDTFTIVNEGVYADDTLALRVYDSNGEVWATLTVCIPGTQLEPGEYLVKTWAENEPMRKPILDAGLFEDTGRRVPSGDYVEAEVWRATGFLEP